MVYQNFSWPVFCVTVPKTSQGTFTSLEINWSFRKFRWSRDIMILDRKLSHSKSVLAASSQVNLLDTSCTAGTSHIGPEYMRAAIKFACSFTYVHLRCFYSLPENFVRRLSFYCEISLRLLRKARKTFQPLPKLQQCELKMGRVEEGKTSNEKKNKKNRRKT